jgi:hypothetical protein
MMRRFRSSMPMVWNLRLRSVVSLCSESWRMLATRACSFASFFFSLGRLADPFCCGKACASGPAEPCGPLDSEIFHGHNTGKSLPW